MANDGVKKEYKEMILKALEYHFPAAKVYLFGSRARGDFKSGADIDLALDAGNEILPREMARARVTLEHLYVPQKIDIVDMHSISKELKETILQEGVIWKS